MRCHPEDAQHSQDPDGTQDSATPDTCRGVILSYFLNSGLSTVEEISLLTASSKHSLSRSSWAPPLSLYRICPTLASLLPLQVSHPQLIKTLWVKTGLIYCGEKGSKGMMLMCDGPGQSSPISP